MNAKEKKITRQAVGAIIICKARPKEILIVKKVSREDTDHNETIEEWDIPKGGIKSNETAKKALIRELGEEIGSTRIKIIKQLSFELNFEFPPTNKKYFNQQTKLFLVEYYGKPENLCPKTNEIGEIQFCPIKDLDKMLSFEETKNIVLQIIQSEFQGG